jgi:hypothetical protein
LAFSVIRFTHLSSCRLSAKHIESFYYAANRLLHPYWRGYEACTLAANWHQLFTDTTVFQDDDRSALTWSSRFSAAAPVLYNFWSSGDEVLEIATYGAPTVAELIWSVVNPWSDGDPRQYTWHKQELYKGRNLIYGTGWAGWGFAHPLIQTAEGANLSTDEILQQYPIFERDPSYMFTNVILQANIDNILIKGIPALSPPIGQKEIRKDQNDVANIDMNKNTTDSGGIERPNSC